VAGVPATHVARTDVEKMRLLLDRGATVAPPDGAPPKIDDAFIAIGTSRTTPMLGAFKFGDTDVIRTCSSSARRRTSPTAT